MQQRILIVALVVATLTSAVATTTLFRQAVEDRQINARLMQTNNDLAMKNSYLEGALKAIHQQQKDIPYQPKKKQTI